MDNADQHGKYGDTPLGKSDEELRQAGADAQTNDERRAAAAVGSEAEVPMPVPLATTQGGVSGVAVPAIVNTEVDPETHERGLRTEDE